MTDIVEELIPIDPTENEAELVARFIREAEESAARVAQARAARDAAIAVASMVADG